ncbi:MAG: thioredoxin family protein [bacterium]|nr:thioredoxin family protein [bacterium]
MATEGITQLKLKTGSAGVVGLPELLEEAQSRSFSGDDELKDFLLEGIKARNFVSPGSQDEYKEALYREYKKSIGEPLAEESRGALEICILGPGCPRCNALEQATMAALTELNVAADVQHVKNHLEIARYGILGTPGLVVNGKVKSSGKVLSKEQIKAIISEEMQR